MVKARDYFTRSGSTAYSKYRVDYELRYSPSSRYGSSLYMKLARASKNKWKYMGNVHPSISSVALKQFARDYLIQLGMITPRY